MSLLGSLVESVQTKVQEAADGPIVTLVKGVFQEFRIESNRDKGKIIADFPGFMRNAPLIDLVAASATEENLLEHCDDRMRQLAADKHLCTPIEFKRKVIETIRDIKVQALEQDGRVNPIDSVHIKALAGSIRSKVRTKLALVVGGDSALDDVEQLLLTELSKTHARDYEQWMRNAQATIWAVAEIRLQKATS